MCVRVSACVNSLLVLFDQHAVDERIRLERFTQGASSLLISICLCFPHQCILYEWSGLVFGILAGTLYYMLKNASQHIITTFVFI